MGQVIIVSALSLSLRDKERLRDRESLTIEDEDFVKHTPQSIFKLDKLAYNGLIDLLILTPHSSLNLILAILGDYFYRSTFLQC